MGDGGGGFGGGAFEEKDVLRYERKDRFHRLAIEGLISLFSGRGIGGRVGGRYGCLEYQETSLRCKHRYINRKISAFH